MVILYAAGFLPLASRSQIPPIGHWRDHLPYHQAIRLTDPDNGNDQLVWCATPYSVFSINLSDKSIERWSKTGGLSETGISAIAQGITPDQLIIAYNSSNVDILEKNKVINIDDIKRSPLAGNKTIFRVHTRAPFAYLSTGIGIIVIDLQKHEVRDTWIIGSSGSKTAVYATGSDDRFFYAATAEGLKKAPVNSNNLADFRNWQLVSGTNALPNGPVQSVSTMTNSVIVLKNDSLFVNTGTNWSFLYTDGWTISDCTITGGKILLSESQPGTGRIVVLTPAGNVERIIQDPSFISNPRQAILHNNEYWIADSLTGLSKFNGSSFEQFIPNSPYSFASGNMQVLSNMLWAAAGAVNTNWEPTGNKNGLYTFSSDTWTNFNNASRSLPDSLPDLVSLAIDPRDASVWAGSYGGGLLHFKSGQPPEVFKQRSPLQPAYFSPGSYRVSGLSFDTENNLWVANYGSPSALLVRKPDGNWRSFIVPFPVGENALSQIVIDDAKQVWTVSPKSNGLFCFNYGASVDNPADDRWKWYRAGKGNGNLPHDNVLSIAKDKSGFIWVGTMQGVGIIQCPQEAFSNAGCEAVIPVVQQDNFAGYLFGNEQVQAIAVDGADRKWVGTQHGVWLISADGAKTIYRFAEENSPLLSNDVRQIAIDGNTGEVFFATAKGICSFRSTATEGTNTNTDVLVFPNPVPPGYNGTIAIRGVANNSIVKITEMDGRLVYQTRALGGQAIWNGKTYQGAAISTGIYLVLIRDDAGNEKMVTKIVFIKK